MTRYYAERLSGERLQRLLRNHQAEEVPVVGGARFRAPRVTTRAVPVYFPVISWYRLGNRASTAQTTDISRLSTDSPILWVFCSMPGPMPNMAG